MGWSVDEELSCLFSDSVTRRCDIVATDPDNRQIPILDATVRFEIVQYQVLDVDLEMFSIYEPCIADIAE